MAVTTRTAPWRPWRGALRDALRRVGIRVGALSLLALVLANLRLPWRPSTLCPMRTWLGVPCPLCGTTTAAVHLGHLDVVAALAANPVTLVVIGLAVTAPLTGAGRLWDETLTNKTRPVLCVALLVVAEVWQLHRFGLLP